MKNTMYIYLLLALPFFALVTSCKGSDVLITEENQHKMSLKQNDASESEQEVWLAQSIEGLDEVPNENRPYLMLNDGRVSGFSGCNRLNGAYKLMGESLKISSIGMTKMYCGEAISKIENAFVENIQKANKAVMKEDGLFFYLDDTLLVHCKAGTIPSR